MSTSVDQPIRLSLGERHYPLTSDEVQFFKSQTGVEDEEALKHHITEVGKKAYHIYRYICIRNFSFAKFKISRLPAYPSAFKLCRERPGAILLDMGCCFGSDVRKAVADGWPVQNVIASDIRQEFWEMGHELFKSTPQKFRAAFVPGDALDPAIIAPRAPFTQLPQTPRPDLASLRSLTPIQGHVSAIHASLFFHLFDEDHQLDLARRLATLLSPLPGSIIFGYHVSLPQKGFYFEEEAEPSTLFCHPPESWCELWDGLVFEKGSVKTEARLEKSDRRDLTMPDALKPHYLYWSVTRV